MTALMLQWETVRCGGTTTATKQNMSLTTDLRLSSLVSGSTMEKNLNVIHRMWMEQFAFTEMEQSEKSSRQKSDLE